MTKHFAAALLVACCLGSAAVAETTGGAGLSAEQAKDKAIAAGYRSISSLVKNGDGIWRASAMKDGKATRIVVDREGNVVPVAE
ncbi:MAG: PepSY domain-containing protein [Reyranellaceae bacterium]